MLLEEACNASSFYFVTPRDSSKSARPKNPQYDSYYLNPKGHLSRCRCRARYQLIILDSSDIAVLLRCQACRNELYIEIESGVTFEILDEAPVEEPAFDSKRAGSKMTPGQV